MPKTFALSTALATFTILGSSALAQTPPPPPPPPVHHGIFSKIFHPKPKTVHPATGSFGRPGQLMPEHPMPGQTMPGHMMPGRPSMGGRPGMGGMMPMHGGVVGNKNSHIYHLPGDKGSLPAQQNRIYFSSAATAEAAGYHRAGSAHSTTSRHPQMQGTPTHGMPGSMHH